MNAYEQRRAEQIKKNQELLKELGIQPAAKRHSSDESEKPTKRQKLSRAVPQPSRSSRRIASSAFQPDYSNDGALASRESPPQDLRHSAKRTKAQRAKRRSEINDDRDSSPDPLQSAPYEDLDALRAGWSSWTSSAAPPTRDEVTHEFRFEDHPTFTPNKSPAEMLREGAFGGSYFRPYRSKRLGITVDDDWKELPDSWLEGLDVPMFVTSSTYDPEVNKYKVSCGQSIEEWEAAGWIDHRFDVRGWFQWFCRFFQGRRCDDDERQIGRWRKCVGETGRWRRILLKKYVAMGVRDVADEGNDEEGAEVSPAVHQTCHHWAYEVRQEVLDRWWAERR